MPDNQEKILYKGGPSQMLNLVTYVICGFMLLLAIVSGVLWENVLAQTLAGYKVIYFCIAKLLFVFTIFWAGKAWILTKTHKYQITSERLQETEGVFSRATYELELFRVRDITFSEPFFLRLVGCGDIILNTTDKTSPIIVIHGLKNARQVMDLLRKNVDIMRGRKGVRDIEM